MVERTASSSRAARPESSSVRATAPAGAGAASPFFSSRSRSFLSFLPMVRLRWRSFSRTSPPPATPPTDSKPASPPTPRGAPCPPFCWSGWSGGSSTGASAGAGASPCTFSAGITTVWGAGAARGAALTASGGHSLTRWTRQAEKATPPATSSPTAPASQVAVGLALSPGAATGSDPRRWVGAAS
jgi:hypothetical protein